MPPKGKASSKVKEAEIKTKEPELPPPTNANERTLYRFYQTNPLAKRRENAGGLHALTQPERQVVVNTSFIPRIASKQLFLSNKADREFWKQAAKESLPARRLAPQQKIFSWGTDRLGRDIGGIPLDQFDQRILKEARLAALEAQSSNFAQKKKASALSRNLRKPDGTPYEETTPGDIAEERARRKEMAALKGELYGEKMGPYATDPEWDDVVPIPAQEPEGALAAIAYPDDYLEVISYLRAVMAAEEYSPRALRLTEHVIDMNPAHYTVWLYRFKIVQELGVPLVEEFKWLNGVSLDHLKNYQIWHHRQLLLDHFYPQIADDADEMKKLARNEVEFIKVMLQEDTKNYHVWSYRQYLVRKLAIWTPQELGATQSLIEDDVRNNSAWSHRFFLVFSDPKQSTPGLPAMELDPAVPAEVVDREIHYAQEKTKLAPQNQSSWNYLRGVLVKGGRKLGEAEELAAQFVSGVGEGEDGENVQSSHALDLLADIYAERGDTDKATLYLDRLAEKWDPIRAGYWNYRKRQLTVS